MTEYNDNDYRIPTSLEGSLSLPESDVDRALREALEAAPDTRTLDTNNVDRSRTETVGAATITSAVLDSAPAVAAQADYYDPSNTKHLLLVGQGIRAMRLAETGEAA